MEKGKSNTILLTVIAIATLLVVVVGATFAYFSAQLTGNETASTITIQASNGGTSGFDGGDVINPDDIYPRSEAWVNKIVHISYTNANGVAGTSYKYKLGLTYTNGFEANDLQYTFTAGACPGTPEKDETACGGNWKSNTVGTSVTGKTGLTALATGAGNESFTGGVIPHPATTTVDHYYTLRIYFVNNPSKDQEQGRSFYGYVTYEEDASANA